MLCEAFPYDVRYTMLHNKGMDKLSVASQLAAPQIERKIICYQLEFGK